MELALTFSNGTLRGEGRDPIGNFTFRGHYDCADGKCHWTKRYVGKHDVFYKGFNEGKGIWGVWEISDANFPTLHGGFHIWPEGMPDPTQQHLVEEAELPVSFEQIHEELVPAGSGTTSDAGGSALAHCLYGDPVQPLADSVGVVGG